MPDRTLIMTRLATILRANLNDSTLEVSDDTRPDRVPGWSSIKMVDIVLDAEDEFGVRLPVEDIDTIRTAGDLADAIVRQLA